MKPLRKYENIKLIFSTDRQQVIFLVSTFLSSHDLLSIRGLWADFELCTKKSSKGF